MTVAPALPAPERCCHTQPLPSMKVIVVALCDPFGVLLYVATTASAPAMLFRMPIGVVGAAAERENHQPATIPPTRMSAASPRWYRTDECYPLQRLC